MAKNLEKDILSDALDAWRQDRQAERLSAATRASILERARRSPHEAELPRLAQLFVPLAKIAYAGAVPVLVLALTLGWLAGGSPRPTADFVTIEGSKVNGEAVFRIANGGRVHHVYRSSSPRENAEKELLATTDDAFRDRLGGTTGVVYYRID